MRGYAIKFYDKNEQVCYLQDKRNENHRELITYHFDEAGFWTLKVAERIAAKWEKIGYKVTVVPDLHGV